MLKNKHGFTIVELLIVIVVIGILAAITIVSYNGIQQRARIAVLQSDLRNSSNQLEVENAQKDSYPSSAAAANDGKGLVASAGTTYQYVSIAPFTEYCLAATNAQISYYLTSNDATIREGVCPEIISNLVPNPGVRASANGYNSFYSETAVLRNAVSWSSTGNAARLTIGSSAMVFEGIELKGVNSAPLLAPGTQYTASWRVVTSRAGSVRIESGSAESGGSTNASSGVTVTSAGIPVKQWITFTTGSNSSWKLATRLGTTSGWQSGDYIEVSEFMLSPGNTQYDYADGASPGWSWAGTPNNSASSGPRPSL